MPSSKTNWKTKRKAISKLLQTRSATLLRIFPPSRLSNFSKMLRTNKVWRKRGSKWLTRMETQSNHFQKKYTCSSSKCFRKEWSNSNSSNNSYCNNSRWPIILANHNSRCSRLNLISMMGSTSATFLLTVFQRQNKILLTWHLELPIFQLRNQTALHQSGKITMPWLSSRLWGTTIKSRSKRSSSRT